MHVHRPAYTCTHTCVIVKMFDSIKLYTSNYLYLIILYGIQCIYVTSSLTCVIKSSKHKGVHTEVYTCIQMYPGIKIYIYETIYLYKNRGVYIGVYLCVYRHVYKCLMSTYIYMCVYLYTYADPHKCVYSLIKCESNNSSCMIRNNLNQSSIM